MASILCRANKIETRERESLLFIIQVKKEASALKAKEELLENKKGEGVINLKQDQFFYH